MICNGDLGNDLMKLIVSLVVAVSPGSGLLGDGNRENGISVRTVGFDGRG